MPQSYCHHCDAFRSHSENTNKDCSDVYVRRGGEDEGAAELLFLRCRWEIDNLDIFTHRSLVDKIAKKNTFSNKIPIFKSKYPQSLFIK